jgi:D-threo-aldose 1-dehydrogenase
MADAQIALAPLGFGCAQLFRLHSSREREAVLAAAYDTGIRHFDVAPLYGLGEAEAELGRFLQGKRDSVTVTTKFGLEPAAAMSAVRSFQGLARRLVGAFPPVKRFFQKRRRPLAGRQAFDATTAERSLDRSLRLLKVEQLDYFLLHEPTVELIDRDRPMDFLRREQDRGRIRNFGVAGPAEHLTALIERYRGLAAVIQSPACALGEERPGFGQPPDGVSFVYGSIAPRITGIEAILGACPAARDEWLRRFGSESVSGRTGLARLLLVEQRIATPRSTVLFGTTSPSHVGDMARLLSAPEQEAATWIRTWAKQATDKQGSQYG